MTGKGRVSFSCLSLIFHFLDKHVTLSECPGDITLPRSSYICNRWKGEGCAGAAHCCLYSPSFFSSNLELPLPIAHLWLSHYVTLCSCSSSPLHAVPFTPWVCSGSSFKGSHALSHSSTVPFVYPVTENLSFFHSVAVILNCPSLLFFFYYANNSWPFPEMPKILNSCNSLFSLYDIVIPPKFCGRDLKSLSVFMH